MGFGHSQRGSHRETRSSCARAALVVSEDYSRFLQPGEHGGRLGGARRAGSRSATSTIADATRKTFPVVEGQRVVDLGRPRLAGGRRHAAAVRPRLAGGQHRRGEGLRRGGRGGAARAPRRRRRAGGRPAERTVGSGDRRAGGSCSAGRDVDRRATARRTARRSWRGSRRPRSSSSSSRSVGWATARPTTAGRKAKRHNRRR